MRFDRLWKCSILIAAVSGCVDVGGPEMPPLASNDILAEISVRSRAIMIAQGDSHQIQFDLIAMNEGVIPYNIDNITWVSQDPLIVSVNEHGVLYGADITDDPVQVTVSYNHNYVTKFDTVSIYVTNGRIDANEIRLIAIDSTRVGGSGMFGNPRVRVDLYKNGSLVRKGALIPITVEEPAEAIVDGFGGPDREPVYRITNMRYLIGKFWVRSSLNLYGNEVNDSLSFTGLNNDFINPAIGIWPVADPLNPPVTVLDTMPLNLYQLCAMQMIMNLSMDAVDIVYSDSAASPTGCDPVPESQLDSMNLGFPRYGQFIGGNVLNMPPYSLAFRKSSTAGIVSYRVRKSATGEYLPTFTNHLKQADVQD